MRHFIFNGRFGDICHSLPAVYEYAHRTGERVRFTAAAEFASILEGCAYIEAHAAPCPWPNIQSIIAYAKGMFPKDELCVMACYGKDYSSGYECWSFLRESWKLSACPTPPESQPLIFDNRDKAREQALVNLHTSHLKKPFILVSTHGKSSPFAESAALMADIAQARPDLAIVDLAKVQATRVYDLLGLYEKAVALVTIDTMHLHLSAAVPSLPVLALVCNGPSRWNRSDWRPQQVWRSTYAEYGAMRNQFKQSLETMKSTPQICHVWSHIGERSPDTVRRMTIAQDSWQQEVIASKNWQIKEVTEPMLPRLMRTDVNLPYVKDLIECAAAQLSQDNDIISLSNGDVGCVQGMTGQVLDVVREHGCAYTHRHDLQNARIENVIQSESEVGRRCAWYPGSDWFFMTVAWWNKHKAELPDMVVGREFWDCVLRQLMKKHGTREICKAVWHEKHPSAWEQPGNRENLPGNKHNRALAMRWFAENRSDQNDPFRNTWNIQPTTQHIDPKRKELHRETIPNLVFPTRLMMHQNQVRRIPR